MKRWVAFALTMTLTVLLFGCSTAQDEAVDAKVTTTTTTATTTTTTTATTTTTTTALTAAAATKATVSIPAQHELNPTYSRWLLVNASHTLTANHKVDLVSVPTQYCNGSLRQVDRGIYPYLMSMLRDAWSDGVKLYVRSPYRSYASQKNLYDRKVNGLISGGASREEAELKAARYIARPGTSEHQTGLAIDFNVADSEFEQLPAYTWMKQNAENYGFVLRYPADKTDVTGIIYESWHWRFVGIETAREMNRLGLTLEEYTAQYVQGGAVS